MENLLTKSERRGHKVSFGRTARTLVYEDAAGILDFTFECSPAEGQSGKKWNLHLGKQVLVEVGGKLEMTDGETRFERERLR